MLTQYSTPKKRLSLVTVGLLILPALIVYLVFVANLKQRMTNAEVQNFTFWMNKLRLKQDDPDLVRFVREELLIAPNAKSSNLDVTGRQGKILKLLAPYFDNITNGFVVEIGSSSREQSVSISWLLRTSGWSGFTIEPSSHKYSYPTPDFESINRNIWLVNAGLSRNPFPELVKYELNSSKCQQRKFTQTQYLCIPLYTLLLAVGRTDVAYLRVNTNGSELDILETIPFHKVQIRTLSVTYPTSDVRRSVRTLTRFMKTRGYRMMLKYPREAVFAHRHLLKRV